MANTWQPAKGRETADMVKKIRELIDAVNSKSTVEGNVKKYQDIISVKKEDGTYSIQVRTKDGLIESDPTSPTGFKKI